MSTEITLNVRLSTGQIFQVEVDTSYTVEELKAIIASKMDDVDASQLKLVFSGRILKDEEVVSECKLVANCTVHVVRSGGNKAPKQNTTSDANTPPFVQQQEPIPPIPPTPSPSTLTGLGGVNPFGGLGGDMANMDPEVMRQMMDSPFMQNIMGNTDFVRSIIMSNPQMKALVEQNPELGHVISDPAFLRQSMEMMRNPELMREMQRNNDRALSNIEAIPGGFNHLRRMYNTFQGPLENAMSPSANDEANERMARELNVESVPENSLNTQALPNPWAANNNTNNNNTSPSSTAAPAAAANPFAAFAAAAAAAGGNHNSSSNTSATPANNNWLFPFGQPAQQNQPQNQQQTPFWADPNFIQASMRMQAMMSSQPQNNPQQPNLLQQMMMGGGGINDFTPNLQSTQQSGEPPEIRFRDQLAQLEDMGFGDPLANMRALLATGGNVQAAIEYLLQ